MILFAAVGQAAMACGFRSNPCVSSKVARHAFGAEAKFAPRTRYRRKSRCH